MGQSGTRLPDNLAKAITGAKKNMDPANNSVLDPWYERLMRTVGSLVGVGDPEGSVIPEMAPMGVTSFIKGSGPVGKFVYSMKNGMKTQLPGVPDVPARIAATLEAQSNLGNLLNKFGLSANAIDHVKNIAAKYPRVMAHNDLISELKNSPAYGMNDEAWTSPKRSIISLSQPENFVLAPNKEITDVMDAQGPANTFIHELTHTAQRIMKGRKFPSMYEDALKKVGYVDNPFEVSARAAAEKRTTPLQTLLEALLKKQNDAGGPLLRPKPAK